MQTFTWTKIQTGQPQPIGCHFSSLTPLNAMQLVLYGGEEEIWPTGNIWILDLRSSSWRQHTASKARGRCHHTGTTGDSSVIIVGGYDRPEEMMVKD